MSIHIYEKTLGVRKLKDGVTIEKVQEKYPEAKKVVVPSFKTLEEWDSFGFCKTPCGCKVEPDGVCQHGTKSWMLLLGLL